MPLIEGNQLLQRFHKRLSEATQVDIAVAWTRQCDALKALYRSVGEGKAVRIVVGVSGNVTDPKVLRCLQESAKQKKSVKLRIARSPRSGIFHPKYYCFHGPTRTICWVGSANLTKRGFGHNEELVHEFEDSTAESRKWFESLWKKLKKDPGPDIDAYAKRYQTRPVPDYPDGPPELTSLSEGWTWNEFVRGLHEREARCRWRHEYTVFGASSSYFHTISTGQKIARRADWGDLKRRECHILRGFEREEEEGRWGLLGSLERTGAAYVFNPSNRGVKPVRRKIREQVERVLNAGPDEIAEVAHDAMETIKKLKYAENKDRSIGPAAATRLLALARPDRLVSVNSKSAVGLGKLLGSRSRSGRTLTTPGSLADNYEKLLNWVYEQPWFKAPQPDDPPEGEIWKYRAALLDAFVYEELNG